MKHSVCIVDDDIPSQLHASIDDSRSLNSSNLQLLLQSGWEESPLRDLVAAVVSDGENWDVSAFRHPNLLLKEISRGGYRPDIVIFDWDYSGGEDDAASLLEDVLKQTFSVVFIYSKADQDTLIDAALTTPNIRKLGRQRVRKLMKGTENSPKLVLDESSKLYDENFSFRFGKEMRNAVSAALDSVLVDFGQHDIRFVAAILGEERSAVTDLNSVVTERIKNLLRGNERLLEVLVNTGGLARESCINLIEFICGKTRGLLPSDAAGALHADRGAALKMGEAADSTSLWIQRLYYHPSDNLVRSGDIVKKMSSNELYLVVSSDCDLLRVWEKNLGYVNLIPLHGCMKDRDMIRNLLSLIRDDEKLKKDIQNISCSSITNVNNLPEGSFILPFISVGEETDTFLGFPKQIQSVFVPPPALSANGQKSERKSKPLIYDVWTGFERVSRLSDSFAGPLIQKSLDSISGQGAADYPKPFLESLKEAIGKLQ